jgi:hypothetical protein
MRGWTVDVRKLERMARPDPCQGCINTEYCKSELRACRSFQHYVNSGGISHNLTKIPTRKIFNEIFYEDEELTMAQLRKQLRRDEV